MIDYWQSLRIVVWGTIISALGLLVAALLGGASVGRDAPTLGFAVAGIGVLMSFGIAIESWQRKRPRIEVEAGTVYSSAELAEPRPLRRELNLNLHNAGGGAATVRAAYLLHAEERLSVDRLHDIRDETHPADVQPPLQIGASATVRAQGYVTVPEGLGGDLELVIELVGGVSKPSRVRFDPRYTAPEKRSAFPPGW